LILFHSARNTRKVRDKNKGGEREIYKCRGRKTKGKNNKEPVRGRRIQLGRRVEQK